MIDTMLATWGLSLFLIGLITTIFGNTVKGISAPLGGFAIGAYHASVYGVVHDRHRAAGGGRRLVRLRFTRFGLIVRATMQNPAWPPPSACRRRAST